MSRTPIFALLALGLALVPAARGDDKADDAKGIALKVTAAGAALFDVRDAKGLALTYTDDARLDMYQKESDGGPLKVENRTGRAEIQGYYEELFKNDTAIHARSSVDAARFLGDDLVEFAGVFEPNTEAAEPLKIPYHQIRIRQGDTWKVVLMQIFIIPKK